MEQIGTSGLIVPLGPWKHAKLGGNFHPLIALSLTLGVSTALAMGTRETLHPGNTVAFYYLAVFVAALFGGYRFSLASSAASVTLFIYFILPPHNAFLSQYQEFTSTLASMGIFGALVSWFTHGLRAKAEMLDQANRKQQEEMARQLARAGERESRLLGQSRQIEAAEAVFRMAHHWRQPLTAFSLTLDNLLDRHAAGQPAGFRSRSKMVHSDCRLTPRLVRHSHDRNTR